MTMNLQNHTILGDSGSGQRQAEEQLEQINFPNWETSETNPLPQGEFNVS